MRHVNYVLKPLAIDSAKPKDKAYSLTDGGGLIIEILPSGTKTWRFKYHLDGKREKVTIGSYPAFSIKQARDKHEELRALVERGESPAKAKQAAQVQRVAEQARSVTFEEFSARWAKETLTHKSEDYRLQMLRWLDSFVCPAIGSMPLCDVKPAHVLAIIEDRKETPTTAEGIRALVQRIYNFAIRKLLVDSNPATGLKGAISVPAAEHHTHLTEMQLGTFWRQIDVQGAHACTLLASKLLMLTMVRKMELLRSKKPEFDLDAAIWDIPAERMKMRLPHRVYLSRQAVELLRHLFHYTQASEYVFPAISSNRRHMAAVTLNKFFKRMDFGAPDFSPHGTRGTAATLLREHKFGKDVVDLLLAHQEGDQTDAAYFHHEMPEERARALQFLADRIDKLAEGGEVVRLRA